MTRNKLTNERIREILCAPESTDDIEDIDFDDDFDENLDLDAERLFAEDYVREWLDDEEQN